MTNRRTSKPLHTAQIAGLILHFYDGDSPGTVKVTTETGEWVANVFGLALASGPSISHSHRFARQFGKSQNDRHGRAHREQVIDEAIRATGGR
jgi:hypothetical protein